MSRRTRNLIAIAAIPAAFLITYGWALAGEPRSVWTMQMLGLLR